MVLPRGIALATTGLALATLGVSAPPHHASGALCSLISLPLARGTSETYFVATALRDTAFAGVGDVKPTQHEGHWGRGEKRAVFGQLVRIDTLGGAHVDLVRQTLTRLRSRDVVVVPWDYDPGCEPTYWSGSARWVRPGRVGFYILKLRPRIHWAGDRPTFDASPVDLEPYPHGPLLAEEFRDAYRTRPRSFLTAREMFHLYEVLPVSGERSLDARALEPMERWAREHPDLARKVPAKEILEWNRERARGRQ